MEAVPIYNVNPGGGSFGGWEALALMNQNRGGCGGYGMDGGWFAWIIILLLFGWGGRGGYGGNFGGNGCGCGCGGGYSNFAADLAVGNATATARNEAGLDFIAQGVNGIRTTLCEQNVNLCNQFGNVINAINTNGYQTQLGQRDLQMQLSNCCCQTQQNIAALNANLDVTSKMPFMPKVRQPEHCSRASTPRVSSANLPKPISSCLFLRTSGSMPERKTAAAESLRPLAVALAKSPLSPDS